ncbi:hypothetical protein [Dietzia sp. PP-33]|uniref:hypothetical protein n=1 Tax=Dietzia sp. PP-33 TaxID=2957500 RepID=UPI0029AEF5A8|nr:hypothetical protein [Dietzia sp. PP-33]MDX2358740.1 hypothetical protein [Dietzia sp. PP-33]
MNSFRRKSYLARVLVCTPLILLMLWFIFADVSEWLQFTVVVVTVIAIWIPYERVFDSKADTEPPIERHR